MGHQKMNNECVSLEEVRRICGGDYSLADQVVELLEREAECVQDDMHMFLFFREIANAARLSRVELQKGYLHLGYYYDLKREVL